VSSSGSATVSDHVEEGTHPDFCHRSAHRHCADSVQHAWRERLRRAAIQLRGFDRGGHDPGGHCASGFEPANGDNGRTSAVGHHRGTAAGDRRALDRWITEFDDLLPDFPDVRVSAFVIRHSIVSIDSIDSDADVHPSTVSDFPVALIRNVRLLALRGAMLESTQSMPWAQIADVVIRDRRITRFQRLKNKC
jgi:hypothetical protein